MWMEQLKKSNDEAIEVYKTRLENASNSWLLASATTLGQHSQTVLDTIAKAAEKRLRETCSEVLGIDGRHFESAAAGAFHGFWSGTGRRISSEEEVTPPSAESFLLHGFSHLLFPTPV